MRQLFKFFLILFLMFPIPNQALGALKGNLEYQIPIDYSKLSEQELVNKSDIYYKNAINSNSQEISDDITTALNLYRILTNVNPNNTEYKIRLGHLYDIIGKDKYAKAAFYQAMGVSPNEPKSYFYFGEFYYRREMYRRALNMYKEAYKKGYTTHYETLYKIGDIYEKLGDSEEAIKYLDSANGANPNTTLNKQILRVENERLFNKEYYSNLKIRN